MGIIRYRSILQVHSASRHRGLGDTPQNRHSRADHPASNDTGRASRQCCQQTIAYQAPSNAWGQIDRGSDAHHSPNQSKNEAHARDGIRRVDHSPQSIVTVPAASFWNLRIIDHRIILSLPVYSTQLTDHSARLIIVIEKYPFSRAIQVFILPVAHRPQECSQADNTHCNRKRNKYLQRGQPTASLGTGVICHSPRTLVGTARKRSALATTIMDDVDMAMAAASGVTRPERAKGRLIRL